MITNPIPASVDFLQNSTNSKQLEPQFKPSYISIPSNYNDASTWHYSAAIENAIIVDFHLKASNLYAQAHTMQVHADYVLQAQIDTSQTQFDHFNYSTVQQHVVENVSHGWHGCYDHVVQQKTK